MSFRSSEFLQRYELTRFQLDNVISAPGNGQHQLKNGYNFTINDRSSLYDWHYGYFEIRSRLQKLADGAAYANGDRIAIINGAHSLISHLMIKSAGKIIYETTNLHKITYVKNLLEYSDDYSRSVAKNSFWYLDTDGTTANTNVTLHGIWVTLVLTRARHVRTVGQKRHGLTRNNRVRIFPH